MGEMVLLIQGSKAINCFVRDNQYSEVKLVTGNQLTDYRMGMIYLFYLALDGYQAAVFCTKQSFGVDFKGRQCIIVS